MANIWQMQIEGTFWEQKLTWIHHSENKRSNKDESCLEYLKSFMATEMQKKTKKTEARERERPMAEYLTASKNL